MFWSIRGVIQIQKILIKIFEKNKTVVKTNGKLLIAIENQYGLKYWCGAREDHTGIPFEGMNQYSFTQRGVRTFSKSALENLVKESGFKIRIFIIQCRIINFRP